MASDINRVILIGRLTRDPELKATNGGKNFCRFSLASNRSIYNRDTQQSRDEVGYFDCVVWGKMGEVIHKYKQKGDRICVEGNLRWSSWEGTDGKKLSKVEINVETFQFLDARRDGAPAQSDGPPAEPAEGSGTYGGGLSEDDIPF